MIHLFKLRTGETIIAKLIKVETHSVNQMDKKFYVLDYPCLVPNDWPNNYAFPEWINGCLVEQIPVSFDDVMFYFSEDNIDETIVRRYKVLTSDE